jgi:cytosine/adenosine deaminase-related metal-dependent hydrolase
MRNNILTDHERTLIKKYLETGERLEGFKVLLHRARKQQPDPEQTKTDLELIKQLLQKAGKEP